MASTRYFLGASHEHFPPEALLQQAVAAERAGFDGISTSDHLQPWWEPGESGHTWIWLGAAGQATSLPLGTGVTSTGVRYHPALIAQAWATLERLFPGRPFLGIGSGEALNEVPVGDEWPSPEDQIARLDEALDMIDGLWTLPDPESTPEVIDAYRQARRKAGKDGDGGIVFQALWSWAETDEAAF